MSEIHTDGGAVVEGGVTVKDGGKFAGRDSITVEAGGVLHLDRGTAQPPPRIPTRIPQSRVPQGLLGREEELAWLEARLTGPGSRAGSVALAGVRGIGGIGKTELAIAIA